MSNIAWSPEDRFVAYAMLAEAGAFGLEVAPGMLFSRSADPLRPEQQEERRALAEIAGAGLSLVSMQSLLFGVENAALFGSADARVPGHGYETVRCAGYAANLNSVAASDARAFCSALI
jgi:hypothetical protein